MSASLINQSGTMNLEYQVSIHTKGDYVAVHLNLLTPSGETLCVDAVTGISVKNNGILEAMLKAEKKWGMDLIKYEPENLKVNG